MEALEIDGEMFEVDIVSVERSFALQQGETGGTAMDARVHYDSLGPWCSYSLTVRAMPGRNSELQRLWDYVTDGSEHLCRLPWDTAAYTLPMYVVGAKQPLACIRENIRYWGQMVLQLKAGKVGRLV